MRPIDPVVVREKQLANRKRETAIHELHVSSDALLWFAEYAMRGQPTGMGPNPDALAERPILIVATSTPKADLAKKYVTAAYREMRETILRRAIELAQDEMAAAERELKS